MLTGGFKTRQMALDALKSGTVDLVGLARALVLDPALGNRWRAKPSSTKHSCVDPVFPRFASNPEGGVTAWYTMHITELASDEDDDNSSSKVDDV